jgi:hypothetical protein
MPKPTKSKTSPKDRSKAKKEFSALSVRGEHDLRAVSVKLAALYTAKIGVKVWTYDAINMAMRNELARLEREAQS